MPHSYNKIWLHVIFSTKNWQPLIIQPAEKRIYAFLIHELKEMGCPVRIANGMPDHVHLLFLLNPNRASADVIKQIKGSSTRFINQEKITPFEFGWQTGYAAFSVSESQLDKTYYYIKNQKEHHQYKAFEEEYKELIELYKATES